MREREKMTREEINGKNISRRMNDDHRFTLSETGEECTTLGYDCHVINYDRETLTATEFANLYPWFDVSKSTLVNLRERENV
jgi:hypothetical protein